MLDDLLTDVERKTRKAREQREERERQAAERRSASDETNRKRNAELREKRKAQAELKDQLAVPPTLFEMEQLVRVRNTYMRRVCKVFYANFLLKELSHESKNRVQRMLTWRKKIEGIEIQITVAERRGLGDDVIDPMVKTKNEYLKEVLLNWWVSVEMYRKFREEEYRLRRAQEDG